MIDDPRDILDELADTMLLGPLMARLREEFDGFELVDHWRQGEFHHDLVFRVDPAALPAPVLVVSTNCNGGIKTILAFDEVPARWALWNARCPDNPEFEGELPPVRGRSRTVHWFDPCRLLEEDARSELKPEHRTRQRGGGWRLATDD